jgi:four helix bundle protein
MCHSEFPVAVAGRYQELTCWQLSAELQDRVFALTASGRVARDEKFCNQIREATRSATNNIAEGFGRFAPKEFRRFLQIARGSLTEVHSQVHSGYRHGYLTADDYDQLSRLAARAAKATGRLMIYLENAHPPRTP